MNHKGQFQSDIPVEALTAREKEVLLLLADHLRYQDIAERLTLALSSVKWYAQTIYSKLGVDNRRDAIERARTSGLLSPPPDERSTSDTQPSHNLPHPLTRFVGREKEMIEVEDLVRRNPLVTLIGSGGVGKTRLALQVSRQLVPHFSQGVWQVELAPIVNPDLVPRVVAAVLGVQEIPSHSLTESLLHALREKQVLLVLDNCEHLLDGVARLVEKLLSGCPNLVVLATSRETFGVPGEVVYRVPSLSFPESIGRPSIFAMLAYDAVDLFIDRAIKVQPGFRLTQENCLAVTNICCRLDGIPLAIELAAARTRVMSPQQIAARMDNVFRLLTGNRRSGLPRQQTLKATIDWSYALLTEKERQALQRFSVFAGNWALDAAESVAAGGDIEPGELLDLLTSLVDKSLVQAYPSPDGLIRYRILETVHQYAQARLMESGELESIRQRHVSYYLHLVEGLEPKLRGREQIRTLDDLGRELDNLRLALEWALRTEVEVELRLACAMQWFWHIRCHRAEGIVWLRQGLAAEKFSRGSAQVEGERAVTRAKALTTLGFLLFHQENESPVNALAPLQEALALLRCAGSEQGQNLAWNLVWLSGCTRKKGDSAQARLLAEEGLSLFRKTGDQHGMAESLRLIGESETDPERQHTLYEEELALDEAVGDSDGIATAHLHIGLSSFINGNYGNACASFRLSSEHFRQVDNPNNIARNKELLGVAFHLTGDIERAAKYIEEALVDYQDLANGRQVAFCLFWKGVIAQSQGRYEQVAELNDEVASIAHKTGNRLALSLVLYLRAHLARLGGDISTAWRYAREALQIGHDRGGPTMHALLELGHLALQEGDWPEAGRLFRQGLQVLIQHGDLTWTGYPLDGLAVLAVRQGQIARAARLYGTRLCRGVVHTFSPIEYAAREADFTEIEAALGEERFEQLKAEGSLMTFMEILALAQEEM